MTRIDDIKKRMSQEHDLFEKELIEAEKNLPDTDEFPDETSLIKAEEKNDDHI